MEVVSPAIGILPRRLCIRNLISNKAFWRKTDQASALHDAVSGRSIFCSRGRKSCFMNPKCVEKKASVSGLTYDVKTRFIEVFGLLKSEILNDHSLFEWTPHSRQRLDQMMDYNVHQGTGKLLRGLSVIDCYISLKEGRDISEDELFLACILGWCIEWFQAAVLVLDDIMDNSESRRSQPCWYKLPKVGEGIAINDGFILLKHVQRILRKHFTKMPYYVDLLNLFNEVEYQTFLGQMMDLMTTIEGENDLLNYSMTLHHQIARYKTSYYSFYLPVACALLLAGENLDNHTNVKDLLLDMGVFFQVVNDYQDCFGDHKGKIGTDIEDSKLSWLFLQALELCSEEQKKIILEHYGKANENDVAKVISIYKEIDLQSVFAIYQSNNYHRLRTSIEAHPCRAVQAIGKIYLDKLKEIKLTECLS